MRSAVRTAMLLTLALLIAVPLSAQDEKKKKGKKAALPKAMAKRLEKVELSDEQKQKIDAVVAEYVPKIAEASGKIDRSAKKAMRDARTKAKEEGKKGKALQEAAMAVLTDEQKAAQTQMTELNQAMTAAIRDVLTPEQQQTAGFKGRKKKKAA